MRCHGERNDTVRKNVSLHPSDVGIVVSIAAFQAVDPGSIPGHRTTKFFSK